MEFEEWELIPGDGILSFHEDDQTIWSFDSNKTVFDMNYFSSSKTSRITVPIIPLKEIEQPQVAKEADQDSVSQVFFKKPEFVEIKMDSSPTTITPFVPQNQMESSAMESLNSPRNMRSSVEKENSDNSEIEIDSNSNSDGGINLLKLSLTGIGAICSFATICILFFGSHHHHQKKITFQIYNHDKKIGHHDAMSAVRGVRGVPLSRAHITFGGCYESL